MLSPGTLGPKEPKSPEIKHQALPYDAPAGLKQPTPASPHVTDNHHRLEPRMQLDVASRSKNFLINTRIAYSVLTSYSRAFSPKSCTMLCVTRKTVTKRFTQTLHCCWDGQVFSHQFLVVPEWHNLETTLIMGGILVPKALQLMLVVGEAMMIPLTGKAKEPWENESDLQVWEHGAQVRALSQDCHYNPPRPHLVPKLKTISHQNQGITTPDK